MKKSNKWILTVAVLFCVTAAYAQNISYTLVSSNKSEAVVRLEFGTYHTETVNIEGEEMQTLHMADAYPVLKAGSPELLQTAFSLIVPEGSQPEMELIDAQYVEIQNFALAPSKGKLYRNINPEDIPYTKSVDYQINHYILDGHAAEIGEMYQLRDFHGVSVKVYPFDYNPSVKVLKAYSSVTVKVRFNSGRSFAVAQKNNRTFDAVYADHFLNYSQLRSTPVTEEGEILIIAPENFMGAMQPYVDWKIRNGYPTEMVTVAAAGNNANAIKAYISNYYNEHNLAFVIIVGDNAQFPTPSISGNKSDNYFTELAGNDSYPDIILGKLSAETVGQLETQVRRFIEYEQNPQETSHFPTFLGIASSQGPGDNNEYDYQHIRNIDNKLQNYTYTSGYELFEGSQGGLDASGSPTASMVSTAVNSGVGIIDYCGHGDVQMWVTTSFNNSNVNALTNVGKLPFIFSVACVNGEYHTGTCFAEAWLRATHNGNPTGAVGMTGSTINQPWNSPMCAQDAMIDLLVGTNPSNQKFTYGGIFFNGMIRMLDVYNDVEVFRTWILFGDPVLAVRTAVPAQLDLAYNDILPIGIPAVTFTSDVDNAKITVTKGDEIIAVGHIVNNAYVLNLYETYLPTDTLQVLATAPNYLPYEGTITFIPNSGPYVVAGDLVLADQNLPFVNNRPNGLPEFGKTMRATPLIANIGNEDASNITINLSSDDEYITLYDNVLTIPLLAAHDTLTSTPSFTFKVDNEAPANHNAIIKMEIIFNNDTVKQSKMVKLYAPQMKIASMSIDDTQSGNGNRKADYGETFTCNITITNTGNMPIVGGTLFLENPGNELILQNTNIPFQDIDINGALTVPVQVTAASSIHEPTITFLKAGLWVNYYYAHEVFSVKIGSVVEDWEMGDFSNMEWYNNSATPWTVVTQTPHSGAYCAKSGAIGNGSSTMLRVSTTATTTDSISFYYKVSSEENYDKLTFKIDGQSKGEWSGVAPWTYASFPVSEGVHTFTWTYTKDYWGSYGSDCAYIDDISFPCGTINHPVGINEIEMDAAAFQVWPNPASDVLHVQLNGDTDNQTYSYQLYSLDGKLLQGGRLSDNVSDIDLRNYVSGVYILKVEDSKHQVQTAKIIKK